MREPEEIELDFTEVTKREKEDRERDEAREAYTKKARESGYIERKRRELGEESKKKGH